MSTLRLALLLVILGQPRLSSAQDPWMETQTGEIPSPTARGGLITFQMAHGLAVGFELCRAVDCGEGATVGVALGGAAAGFAAAWTLTPDAVPEGQATAINSGAIWGFWNALFVAEAARLMDGAEGDFYGTLIAGQLAGLGVGVAIALLGEPTAGDVAFTNLVATWAPLFTLFGLTWARADTDWSGLWWAMLAANDAALVAGALLAPEVGMSRGRALIIQAGGVLGMAGGLAVFFLTGAAHDDPGEYSSPADEMSAHLALGSAFGLVLAMAATWRLDEPADAPAQPATWGVEGGAVVGLSARW